LQRLFEWLFQSNIELLLVLSTNTTPRLFISATFKGRLMQEFLLQNINGIPLLFWAFTVALLFAMPFLTHVAVKGENTANLPDDELAVIPLLANDAAIR